MIHQVKLSKHWNSLTSVQKNQVMKSLSRNQLSGIPQMDQFLLNNSCGEVLKNLRIQRGGSIKYKGSTDPEYLTAKVEFEKKYPNHQLAIVEDENDNDFGEIYVITPKNESVWYETFISENPQAPTSIPQVDVVEDNEEVDEEPIKSTPQIRTSSSNLDDTVQLISNLKSKLEKLKKQTDEIEQLKEQLKQQTQECETKLQKAQSDLVISKSQSAPVQQIDTINQQLRSILAGLD